VIASFLHGNCDIELSLQKYFCRFLSFIIARPRDFEIILAFLVISHLIATS
jgi:hypothetical protein